MAKLCLFDGIGNNFQPKKALFCVNSFLIIIISGVFAIIMLYGICKIFGME